MDNVSSSDLLQETWKEIADVYICHYAFRITNVYTSIYVMYLFFNHTIIIEYQEKIMCVTLTNLDANL